MASFTPLQLTFFVSGFVFFVGALYRIYRSKPEGPVLTPFPIVTAGVGSTSLSANPEETADGAAPVVDVGLPPEWFQAPVEREEHAEEERPKVRPALLVKTERVAQFQFRSAGRPPRASSG